MAMLGPGVLGLRRSAIVGVEKCRLNDSGDVAGVVDATVVSASQREAEKVERRSHSASAHTLPVREHLLDVQVVALELLGENQPEASSVEAKLADVEEAPRAEPVRLIADPVEEVAEHRREHVG